MSFNRWLQNLRSALAPRRGQRKNKRCGSLQAATHRLNLELLEDRRLLAFIAPVGYEVGANPQAVVTADFNNDGQFDLVTANHDAGGVSVLLGDGQGGFGAAIGSASGPNPASIAVGDFNGDGKLDLAAANRGYSDVSVMLGNGDGAFQAPTYIEIGSTVTSVAVGDFNSDGTMDLAVTSNVDLYYPGDVYPDGGQVGVLLGIGDGSFSGPIPTVRYRTINSAVVADVDDDGRADVVAADPDSGLSVLLSNGDGTLRHSYEISGNIRAVAVGDFTKDGIPDLVTAGHSAVVGYTVVGVWRGNGDGTFASPIRNSANSGLTAVAAADFNGDSKLDIITANAGAGTVSVLLGLGDGTLTLAADHAVGSSPTAVTVGDFNLDGWLDVATASGNNLSVLINDGDWPYPPAPSVSFGDVTVTEGNTGAVSATFTLTLSRASDVDVTVHYATANITAAAGSDYTAASGVVVIPAGQTSRPFTIAVKGDRLPEPTETFAVNLSAATNATIGDGQAVGSIIDDEPRISISDATKAEGKKGQTTLFTFTVTLSATYDQPVTMSFKTVNGTATTGDNDYIAKNGTLTFQPGETTKTITIEVKGDTKKEANETFYLDLFGLSSNALFTKNRGLGTIINDD